MNSKRLITIIIYSFLSISLTLIGCSKKEEGCTDSTAINYNSKAEEDDSSCIFDGSVTFWKYGTDFIDSCTVTINGITETLTYNGAALIGPPCGSTSSKLATFTFAPGSYNYSATEHGPQNRSWNSTVQLTSGGCELIRLQP